MGDGGRAVITRAPHVSLTTRLLFLFVVCPLVLSGCPEFWEEVWEEEGTYAVTYSGNGADSGSAPFDSNEYQEGDTVTALTNNGGLALSGYSFDGWNTAANGAGTSYSVGTTFRMGSANVTLYAHWSFNPTYAITVNPTSGLVTTETGGTDTFTVVLSTQPTASVTLDLSSNDTGEGTVSPTNLTFTTSNWSAAQTVTVTGVDDAIDDSNQCYTIVTAAAVSSDANYSGLNAADVTVTNSDNDDTVGTAPPVESWTDVGFWDFLYVTTNAVSGGSSWDFVNIDYSCTTNIVADGFYQYGGNPGAERGVVQTTLLDRDQFTLGIRVNPSAQTNPIIVGGTGYRWLHVAVNNTGTLHVILNNSATTLTTSQPVNVGQWHEIVINIDIATLNVNVYIDSNPPESLSLPGGFAWNFPGSLDNWLSLQNYGNGSAFAGQIDWIYAGNGLLTKDNVNYLVNQF